MNYIEWALQRGAELWRAREEALKKRLSLVPEGTAQKKAAAARGKNDFSLAQEQEVRETESFSLSLERDARRYDGGFLFY